MGLRDKFVEKLSEVNKKTGYSTGKYPSIPFNFKEGRLIGEIRISEVPQPNKTTVLTKND